MVLGRPLLVSVLSNQGAYVLIQRQVWIFGHRHSCSRCTGPLELDGGHCWKSPSQRGQAQVESKILEVSTARQELVQAALCSG